MREDGGNGDAGRDGSVPDAGMDAMVDAGPDAAMDGATDAVKLSVRNLEKVKLIAADQLNVFDLLHANSLVVSEEALAKIQEVYGDD